MTEQDAVELEAYKPLELADKEAIDAFLAADPPQTSELTFTNLFMWRHYYRTQWREAHGRLLLVQHPVDGAPFGLPPTGPGRAQEAVDAMSRDLLAAGCQPRISRAPQSLVEKLDQSRCRVELNRDQSDYVYEASRLISLAGRKLHGKKNHLNNFKKNNDYQYLNLDLNQAQDVLGMQEDWCRLRDCPSDLSLLNEDWAVQEAISHCGELGFLGGVILVDAKVEAFSFGEMLNPTTAVIHIEKANPEISGLYAAINQMFASEAFAEIEYINREQDLGLAGLKKAKESYRPHHLVDKYEILAQLD